MPKTNTVLRPLTLSIGGATYDLFLTLDAKTVEEGCIRLKGGEKVPVKRVIETCGGGACNTSVGLSRLGCDAKFAGVIGSDQWGERLLKTMLTEHVDTSAATIVENETSSFSIIVNLPTGERTILHAPGTSEHLHDTTFDRDAVGTVDAVYLNHLAEASCMIEDDLAGALAAHPSVHLTWNPGGSQISAGMRHAEKKALLKRTNLLLLNKEEAMRFTETDAIDTALRALVDAGAANVCITDGGNGVIASDGKNIYACPVVKKTTIVDTTGAGDAFGTAATWALVHGRGLPSALIAGTLNATSVLGSIGAQAGLLTETDLVRRLTDTPLTVTTRTL